MDNSDFIEEKRFEDAPRKWSEDAPRKCSLCQMPLRGTFVDGRTRGGYWTIMCEDCHDWEGHGLGDGRGQMYDLKTLVKIGG